MAIPPTQDSGHKTARTALFYMCKDVAKNIILTYQIFSNSHTKRFLMGKGLPYFIAI
jgi:hypothetical protein